MFKYINLCIKNSALIAAQILLLQLLFSCNNSPDNFVNASDSSNNHLLLDSSLLNDPNLVFKTTDSSIIYDGIEYKQRIFNIGGKKKYLVEGDILLTKAQYYQYKVKLLQDYYRSKTDTSINLLVTTQQKLVVTSDNKGQPIKWQNGTIIKYAIIKQSFDDDSKYNLVRHNFEQAVTEWMNVCNINFIHIDSLDSSPMTSPQNDLSFIISEYDASGDFIAESFFPNTDISERLVLVDPSYFTTSYDQVGVFRHEIGHIMGFRHEHIRSGAPAVCPKESISNTIDLTKYDPASVMHYFCGGVGSLGLKFSNLDSLGSIQLYGKSTIK